MDPEEVNLIDHISDLLASGDTRTVKSIMNEDRFNLFLQERANDLVPIAGYYINKETSESNPAVFRRSDKLIEMCAEKGNPKECLMEFYAQIESLDIVKFQVFLKHIQTTMLRIPDRKAPLMQCIFNTIYSFINSLPLPTFKQVDNKSKLLLDCDENALRITEVYNMLVIFYEPFVNEASEQWMQDDRNKKIRLVLLQALFQLLGNPLNTLDLEINQKCSSTLSVYASNIIRLILKLEADPVQFLRLADSKDLISVDEEKYLVKEFSSNEIKFSCLSVSVFFYLIFAENMCTSVPCVYNKLFIFQNSLDLAITLLRYKEALVLRKGLLLTKVILRSIEPSSVSFYYLDTNVHKEVIELLSNIAVYHDVEENRKLAVELIKQHIFVFEPKAQFYILLNSTTIAKHPNIVGFITTILTNVVRKTFSDVEFKTYFTNKRLFDLLDIFCSLKKGVETDLVENKDQTLSALNLIIFLTKRDRENVTGVWNYVSKLSQNFIQPLREAIDLSRAHYELQLKTLDDPLASEENPEFSVTVGGQELGTMSTEEKKTVINSGLTVFDLIEHLLSRVNESLEDKPIFNLEK